MRVKTDISQFVDSHGHRPRGRTTWLLKLIMSENDGAPTFERSFSHYGTFPTALREAVKHVRIHYRGCENLTMSVQP